LAELAHRAGESGRERDLLLDGVAAGTSSALIHTRLGQIESGTGDLAAADSHYRIATELSPGWALAWALWGETLEALNRPTNALERYRKASTIEPENAGHLLRLGRLYLGTGQKARGRALLERAAALAPDSPEGREARRLLASL
jgi:tetratricopeptide (TPR) repeat protein